MSSEESASSLQLQSVAAKTGKTGQKRTNFRWSLAIFAMLMTFMSYIDRINLAVTTPAIMKELHFTKVQIGTFQTVFFICYALFQIPSGTLTEFFGHRRIVPLALTWWSVFTSLTAVCRGFSTWIVVRALFGMGEAPIYPGLNAAFSYWFPRRERGRAVGMLVMGAKFGPAVGIPAATLIMLRWGWRSVFVTFGALGVVIALAYYLLLRTHPSESRFVNEAELEYIADGQAEIPVATKTMPPWKDMLRSGQVGRGCAIRHGRLYSVCIYCLAAGLPAGSASFFLEANGLCGGLAGARICLRHHRLRHPERLFDWQRARQCQSSGLVRRLRPAILRDRIISDGYRCG